MQGWCLDDCRQALPRCYLELDSAQGSARSTTSSVGQRLWTRGSPQSLRQECTQARLCSEAAGGLATANRVSRPLALESFEGAGQETLKFVHGAVARFYVGGGVMGDRDGV